MVNWQVEPGDLFGFVAPDGLSPIDVYMGQVYIFSLLFKTTTDIVQTNIITIIIYQGCEDQ